MIAHQTFNVYYFICKKFKKRVVIFLFYDIIYLYNYVIRLAVEKIFVEINGLSISYTQQGEGKDVLLLHGWGSSFDAYKGVISALQDKCKLTALSFPGCGESSLPENPLCTDDYVELVLEFIKKLNLENPILVGHSHGCRVIMKAVGTGKISPQKIVFIDGAGLKPKRSLSYYAKVYSYKTAKFFLTLPVVKNYTEETLGRARNRFGSADYNSAPPVMKKTLSNLVNEDMTPFIKNIKASTLLIWGENDTATPLWMAKKLEKTISDCGLCVIKNTGHWSFVENPVQAHAILRSFLP